jgi:predicted nucleotidyltransferase
MTKSDVLNYLSKHYQEFHNKYNVEKIGLFGSYARDEATKDSDIDIFVQMHPYLKKRILRDGIYAV